MEPDYPAAHSMDTVWFAVDDQGYVARFSTGENGHVPRQMRAPDGVSHEIAYDPRWELCLPGSRQSGQHIYSFIAQAQRTWIYTYVYQEGFEPIDPYVREIRPNVPLHVAQLPPALRQECKRIRFDKALFSERAVIQPLEQFECTCWYEGSRAAYLAADRRTVRPVPGMEDEFLELYLRLQEEDPVRVRELYFEGID